MKVLLPDDDRIRALMKGVGHEHSLSLYQAFKQIVMETRLALGDSWRPIGEHRGHGPVLVCQQASMADYTPPAVAYQDVVGTWYIHGAKGVKLGFMPTLFMDLPKVPGGPQ